MVRVGNLSSLSETMIVKLQDTSWDMFEFSDFLGRMMPPSFFKSTWVMKLDTLA